MTTSPALLITAPRASFVAGVDVGGTKTEAVLLDDGGAVAARARIPTRRGQVGIVESIIDAVSAAAGSVGVLPSDVSGVGVGIPGAVNPGTGVVMTAVNVEVTCFPLGAEVSRRMPWAVYVDNDVNLAAFGAASVLGREHTSSLAYLNLGTGMGAGILLDGALYRGSSGAAGEIGHLPFDPSGPQCACGMHGCLELYASGSGLTRLSGDRTVEALFAEASAGDSDASAIVELFCLAVVTAVRTLVQCYDVERVVLGGGVMASAADFMPRLRAVLKSQDAQSPFQRSLDILRRIDVIDIDQPVAAVGAAAWAADQIARRAHAYPGRLDRALSGAPRPS